MSSLAERYSEMRQRTRRLFDLVRPEAYRSRPIALRHPIVFYEGHLPAFSVNTLVKKGLGRPGVDEEFEQLFERGIDPEDAASADRRQPVAWPAREEVLLFADACDALVLETLASGELREAAETILEHEAMHQETMLYMWHQLPYEAKRAAEARADVRGVTPPPASVAISAGRATLGARPGEIPFGWDNEFPGSTVDVPAFEIDVHDVTSERFLDFVDAGGYRNPAWWAPADFAWIREAGIEHPRFWARRDGAWMWRGMFEEIDLPAAWPAYVSHAEASAYARWKGSRLPTEAEYHRAAFSDPPGHEHRYPWGEEAPDETRGLFGF